MKLVVLFLAASVLLSAQAGKTVFRTGISLVRVGVQVVEHGAVVRDLTKEDFVLRDNGTPQQILYFGQEEDPLDILLVLDTSGSMQKAIEQVSAAAHDALQQLRPGDRVAVTRFTRHASLVAEFTQNRATIEREIARICSRPFGGGTDIHAALTHAAGEFLNLARSGRRRAILLITDGQSEAITPQEAVLRRLWEADAIMNALQVKGPLFFNGGMNLRMRLHGVKLKDIASETGGEILKANRAGEGFRRMIDRMRRRYSLHYAPPAGTPGEPRSISVDLSPDARKRHRAARVHARKAYVLTETP